MAGRNTSGRGCLPVSLVLLALAVAGSFLLYQRCGRRREGPPPPFVTQGRLRVYALDVGQGDSLLVISPGGKSVLVDAGTPQSAGAVIAALRRHAIQGLDLAVATHPHADHIGGMRRVLEAVPVKNFLDSGRTYTTPTFERMLKAVRDRGVRFIAAERGQVFDLDSGAKLEVLSPAGKGQWITKVREGGSVENANSVVLRLSYGNFAMLLTGDAEAETEALIMGAGGDLRAQVLKVGHHGARYATSAAFLGAVRPEAALISCGADNKYGHPTQETLDRLRAAQVRVYRTDLEGELEIASDGNGFQIQPARQAEAAALWQGRQATQSDVRRGD